MHTASIAVLAFAAAAAAQPALNPPPGAVDESGRFGVGTEISAQTTPGDANSVFKITEPGLYYLSESVVVSQAPLRVAIEIAADGVVIDLNGFRLESNPPSTAGIGPDSIDVSDVVVRNGTISGFARGVYGLGVGNTANRMFNTLVHDLIIEVADDPTGFTPVGIFTRDGWVIRGCIVRGSDAAARGILADDSIVSGCRIEVPAIGIDSDNSLVESCYVITTGGFTYNIGGQSLIRGCLGAGGSASMSNGVTSIDNKF